MAGDDAAVEEGRREILNSRIARVMQALRIEVNGEFDALDSLLGDLPRILAPGGCAVFLNFDSGEYLRVKFVMKDGRWAGHYSGVSRAGPEEVRANRRRRCCNLNLRWCVRCRDLIISSVLRISAFRGLFKSSRRFVKVSLCKKFTHCK
jgi:16S rRNA (cytosine1402-N4)-methyltransferase